jgi:glycosyltransferase involved in cell wall biosynthesis
MGKPLKVMQILPEFHEGGVERHVLWLSNEMAKKGHEVLVVTKGGKLESHLDKGVGVWHLPVHAKNPVTAFFCAMRIAGRAKKEDWDILHAHSRVPFWIARWASSKGDIPWVATLHATFKHSRVLLPLKKACACIAVSCSVKDHLTPYLPENSFVIYNGLLPMRTTWQGKLDDNPFKFLFIGRLTPKKGLQVVLKALAAAKGDWILDVLGDGPLRKELESLTNELGLSDKVRFWGFREDTDDWLARCSCLLFPSFEEGMSMTLIRAVKMGVPVLASSIPSVKELCLNPETLIEPNDESAWKNAIEVMLKERKSAQLFDSCKIPTAEEMTRKVLEVYQRCMALKKKEVISC